MDSYGILQTAVKAKGFTALFIDLAGKSNDVKRALSSPVAMQYEQDLRGLYASLYASLYVYACKPLRTLSYGSMPFSGRSRCASGLVDFQATQRSHPEKEEISDHMGLRLAHTFPRRYRLGEIFLHSSHDLISCNGTEASIVSPRGDLLFDLDDHSEGQAFQLDAAESDNYINLLINCILG